MSSTERLQKILADRGLASRRKAEDLIRDHIEDVVGRYKELVDYH